MLYSHAGVSRATLWTVVVKNLDLKTRLIDKTVHVDISGDIDSENAAVLREQLTEAVQEAPEAVMLDLSQVGRMDSAGAAVLAEVDAELRKSGRRLALVGVTEAVAGMLKILGVFELDTAATGERPEGQDAQPGTKLHDTTDA
jgi:anti-sigma B factor antagonist